MVSQTGLKMCSKKASSVMTDRPAFPYDRVQKMNVSERAVYESGRSEWSTGLH
jgi:hypothetical protein